MDRTVLGWMFWAAAGAVMAVLLQLPAPALHAQMLQPEPTPTPVPATRGSIAASPSPTLGPWPDLGTPAPSRLHAPGSPVTPSPTPARPAMPAVRATALPPAPPALNPTPTPPVTPFAPPLTPSPTPAVGPPSSGAAAPVPRLDQWVTNPQPLEMWSSPEADALSLGRARAGSAFELTGSSARGRLFVYFPGFREYAWIDADAVVPAAPPSVAVTAPPAATVAPAALTAGGPERLAAVNTLGRTLGYNVRSWPRVAPETRLREVAHNTPVLVSDAVRGDDGDIWYRVGDGEYMHGAGVRLPKPPPQTFRGRWIDVDLSDPTLMTAYEDDRVVYTALALRGTAVDATPTGLHRVQRRVENETMDSSTIGIPRDSPRGYFLQNVLFTQYFTGDGAAIHYNYWSTHFGYPGTHGCLGINYEDALWFWNWADVGTPVHIYQRS